MPTETQISEVLGEIQDPELHRGLNELNMVRGITIEGSKVTVLVALTIPGCPLKDYFHTVIPSKLKEAFPEISDVGVELTSMTEQERQSLIGGLRKALQQFLSDVHWDEPDYLVIDLPPGTGDVSISIAQFLPGASFVLVTTPQAVAEKVAQRAGFMAEKTGLRVAGVVENMSYFRGDDGKVYNIFGEGGGAALAERLRVPLLGEIPIDPDLRKFADSGAPIVLQNPDSEVAQKLDESAKELVNLLPPKPKPAKRINLPLMSGAMGGHGHEHHHHHH